MRIVKCTVMGLLLFALGASVASAEGQRGNSLGNISVSGSAVTLQPNVEFTKARLTVANKEGNQFVQWFKSGEPISYNLVDRAGKTLADGSYRFELLFVTAQGSKPLTGRFYMKDGGAVANDPTLPPRAQSAEAAGGIRNVSAPDVIVNDDQIVEGSVCSASNNDCADLESFAVDLGDAEQKLKGGVPVLWFADTTAGADDFTISSDDDVWRFYNNTSNRDLMVLTAAGAMGLGTTTPASEIHAVSDKGTFIRLEDTDNSTWDFGTDDTGDFVFNIIVNDAGQGTGQIVTIDDGLESVGIWSANPAATLDVQTPPGTGETAKIRVNDTNGAAAERVLYELNNNGKVRFLLHNRNTGLGWTFDNSAAGFEISDVGDGLSEFILQPNGNLQISGTLTQLSDINMKQDLAPVKASEILEKVAAMPVTEWSYKEDPAVRHIGPMAQDFHAAFGLGATDRGIAAIDSDGIALASIQALYERSKSLEGENAELRNRLAALEAKLQTLVDQK